MAQDGIYKQKVLIRMLEALEQWDVIDDSTMSMDDPDDIFLTTRDGIRLNWDRLWNWTEN